MGRRTDNYVQRYYGNKTCLQCGGKIPKHGASLCRDCYSDEFRTATGYYRLNPEAAGDFSEVGASGLHYSKVRQDLTPDAPDDDTDT